MNEDQDNMQLVRTSKGLHLLAVGYIYLEWLQLASSTRIKTLYLETKFYFFCYQGQEATESLRMFCKENPESIISLQDF